jgi:hypothetical protein
MVARGVRVRGIGRRLMAFADEQARAAGLDHLRVDCYGGGSGDLVRFYEDAAARIAPFNVDGWPGMRTAGPPALTPLRHGRSMRAGDRYIGSALEWEDPPGRSSACTTAVATTKPSRAAQAAGVDGKRAGLWVRAGLAGRRVPGARGRIMVSASPSLNSSRFLAARWMA